MGYADKDASPLALKVYQKTRRVFIVETILHTQSRLVHWQFIASQGVLGRVYKLAEPGIEVS